MDNILFFLYEPLPRVHAVEKKDYPWSACSQNTPTSQLLKMYYCD